MSNNITFSSRFHERNGSDELDVFEAARYFSGASENFTVTQKNMISDGSRNFSITTTQKHCMRPYGRMSLDMPKRNSNIPLQDILLNNNNPIMIKKEIKKPKQPSSPGGKLAHFLNSLFNQKISSKNSKSKPKDEDHESPNGWRRKRRSSISHFMSSNTSSTTTTTIMHDSKSLFSTSSSSGYRTPPTYNGHTPTKTTSYKDHFKSYSYLKPPPSQITIKAPIINRSFNKIDNGLVEKVKMFDEKQRDHYQPHNNNNKYILNKDFQEFKRFVNDEDDGGESDSSSDLFELSNCDLGYNCSSGLPVYETTRMDSINRGAPISS